MENPILPIDEVADPIPIDPIPVELKTTSCGTVISLASAFADLVGFPPLILITGILI